MRKFGARLFYRYDADALFKAMSDVFDLLGFEPRFMDIYYEGYFDLSNVRFDRVKIETHLKEPLTSILIKNELDNAFGNLAWFRLSVDDTYHHKFSFEWSNIGVDFLAGHDYFKKLVSSEYFICGYYYDGDDLFFQTNKTIRYHKHLQDSAFKTTKNQFGDLVIDTSENWGRSETGAGLVFMAAPLMCYGSGFFEIISKEKLLQFEGAILLRDEGHEMVSIKLFELYELPSKKENREKQEMFWSFFDLRKIIDQYNRKNTISEEAWLIIQLQNRNKKKKKK